jgi:hypothetical protein
MKRGSTLENLWQYSRVVVILLKSIFHKDLSLFFRRDLKYNRAGYHQLIPVYYGIGQIQDLRTQPVLQRQNGAFSFSETWLRTTKFRFSA